LKPAVRSRTSSIPRGGTDQQHNQGGVADPTITSSAPFTIASNSVRGTPGAGADGDGMDGGRGQLRQHHGIGGRRQFVLLLCEPEAGGEGLVEFGQAFQHHGADFGIGDRFGARGHHREAAARAGLAGEIDIERDRIDAREPFADRHLVPENLLRRCARIGAVARIALDVELALVAEGAIEFGRFMPVAVKLYQAELARRKSAA
jgi:hypothetical protein